MVLLVFINNIECFGSLVNICLVNWMVVYVMFIVFVFIFVLLWICFVIENVCWNSLLNLLFIIFECFVLLNVCFIWFKIWGFFKISELSLLVICIMCFIVLFCVSI